MLLASAIFALPIEDKNSTFYPGQACMTASPEIVERSIKAVETVLNPLASSLDRASANQVNIVIFATAVKVYR